MQRPRMLVAGVGLAAVLTAGGVTAAAAGSSPAATAGPAVVRTAHVTVGGKTETILVSSQGRPLYTYRPDTASKSFVTGSLAMLWPPLTSSTASLHGGPGVTGKVSEIRDVNGHQVTYNGHPLYTFADDTSGQVSGQAVQNFFVATPGIHSIGAARGSAAPAAPSGGFGY